MATPQQLALFDASDSPGASLVANGHQPPAKPRKRPVLRVLLSNRRAQFLTTPRVLGQLKKFFRYRPDGYVFSPRYQEWLETKDTEKPSGWNGWNDKLHRGCVAAGLFLAKQKEIEKHYRLVIQDTRIHPELRAYTVNEDDRNRPYQIDAITALRAAGAPGGLLIAATQTGKTRTIGRYLQYVEGSALFIVKELTLLAQAHESLAETTGEKIGIIGGGKFQPERITVATVQTLSRTHRKKELTALFADVTVVFIDEVHLMCNARTRQVLRRINARAVFGATASLDFNNTVVAFNAWEITGPVIFNYPIRKAVEEGYLSQAVIVRLTLPQTSLFRRAVGADRYNASVVQNSNRNDTIIGLTCEALRRGHSVLVFVSRVAHAQLLSQLVPERIVHRVVDGTVKQSERRKTQRDFEQGKVRLIIATSVFTHGIVLKALSVTIDATAARSSHHTIQKYGRNTNRTAAKTGAIHIDIADEAHKATASSSDRARVLRTLGARVVRVEWQRSLPVNEAAERVFDIAEKALNKKKPTGAKGGDRTDTESV